MHMRKLHSKTKPEREEIIQVKSSHYQNQEDPGAFFSAMVSHSQSMVKCYHQSRISPELPQIIKQL